MMANGIGICAVNIIWHGMVGIEPMGLRTYGKNGFVIVCVLPFADERARVLERGSCGRAVCMPAIGSFLDVANGYRGWVG